MEDNDGSSSSSTEEEEEEETMNNCRPINESESPEQVMSEVHLGCPPHFSGPHISHFTFPLPPDPDTTRSIFEKCRKYEGALKPQMISFDKDGDLVLNRRRKPSNNCCAMTIQHNITSSIPSVGLQVWKAELVLADFVLHRIFTSSDFVGIVSLELGAGTGLVGILLACVAKSVFLTDCGDEILENCATNIHLNSGIFNPRQTSVYVRELDWKKLWPPPVDLDNFPSHKSSRFSWTSLEVEEANKASLLLAADVIYSDDMTDALFNTLERLMSQGSEKVLYLALEKRYNFSLNDLDVVANGYSHFRSFLKDVEDCRESENGSIPCFVGKCIDLTQIPQYFREYDRGNDVEIWEIKYRSSRQGSQVPPYSLCM